jgi:hypothetical protein
MEHRNRFTVAIGQIEFKTNDGSDFSLSRFPGDSELAISAFPLSRVLSACIGV